MSSKKIFLWLVVIIAIVAGFYLYNSNSDTKSKQKNIGEMEAVLPRFSSGVISSVNGGVVVLSNSGGEFTLTSETQVVGQVKDGTSFKNIAKTTADLAFGKKVIVFYKIGTENQYLATKIQILN